MLCTLRRKKIREMKRLSLIILFFAITKAALGIDMGIIEVSKNYTATLIFSDEIESIIFGNNPIISETDLPSGEKVPIFKYYEMYKTKNNVILRAREDNTLETSITVFLVSGKVYSGLIRYGERKDKLEYDFTNKLSEIGEPGGPEEEQRNLKSINDNQMKNRLNTVMKMKDKYYSLGVLNSEISFMVGNMMNDSEYSYLKIDILNNSASEYTIEGIIFKHTEKKKGKLNKKEVENENIIMPVYKVMPEKMSIKAYTTETVGFVLPIFTTGDRGSLLIQFVEKNGSRNALVSLSANDIAKIDVF